jgi:tetratricopeptide (TPR) repeat protein
MSDVTAILRYGCVFALLAMCAACGPQVSLDALPEIPAVATTDLLPAVGAQLDEARATLERDPADAQLNGRLGMLYLVYKMNPAAESAFRRARLLAPRRFEWAYYHGESLMRLGLYDQAIAALETATDAKPDNAIAPVRLGYAQMRNGDLDAALVTLTAVVDDHPDLVDARFELGRAQSRLGDLDAAAATLEKVLEQNGPFAEGYFALAEVYRRKGDAQRAQYYLDQFERYRGLLLKGNNRLMGQLNRLDRSASALLRRADQLALAGRTDEAIEALQRAVEMDPGSLTAHSALLIAYAGRRDFEAVDRQFREGLKVNPDDPVLHRNLGRARAMEGRYVDAETSLRRALKLNPADATGTALLGVVLEQRKLDAEAERMFNKALQLEPREMLAHTRLAERLLQRDAHAEAVTHLDALARFSRGKDAAKHWRRLGNTYLRLERADDARAAFEAGVAQAQLDGNTREEAMIGRALQRLDKGPKQ